MLLRVVADLQAVPRLYGARVGLVDAGQDAQQRGLAGTVEPEDDHPAALVDREVHVGEHLERAVGLRQLARGERGLAARRRGRELDLRHAVGHALALDALHQLLGALEHRLRRLGLGGLGAHLVGLVGEGLGLVLGVHALALAALLVGLALGEVGLPADVVDVDDRAVGVEVQHPVDAGLEQPDVVGDHHEPALVVAQEVAQPHDRVGVEVVGRLVEQQRLGAGEQDPGQLDPATLTAREGAQRLVHQPVGDADRGGDLGGLGLGGVPARSVECSVGLLVAPHRPIADMRVVAAHLGLGVAQPLDHHVQPTGRQDPVAREHLGVARAWVLGQVAEGAGVGDRPARGQRLAREDLGQRRLAGTVAADEPDAVTRPDPEGDVVHQQTGAGTDFELGDSDHNRLSQTVWQTGTQRGPSSAGGDGQVHLMGRARRGTQMAGGG